MKIYDYIFYRFYNYFTLEKDKDDRAIAVTFIISLFQAFNTVSLIIIIQSLYREIIATKSHYILIFLVFSAANSFIFIYGKRYKNILAAYTEKLREDMARNRKRSLKLLFYVIFSAILLTVAIILESVQGNLKIIERFFEKLF